jgi:AraC-like DNA-binding protein
MMDKSLTPMVDTVALPVCREDTLAFRRQAVERVIATITERLDEPTTLLEMSRIAYISPFHFNRVFHQITGLSPTRFFGALRLDAAKRLLLTTSMSVTNVCYEVGYSSLGTFTTRFTQHVGISPHQFRRSVEHVTTDSLEANCAAFGARLRGVGDKPCVEGRVDAPESFEGFILVGLFPGQIPQSQPAGGALLTRSGNYSIGSVPDGTYHLLAAALPKSTDLLAYLLPEPKSLFVGIGNSPVVINRGQARGPANVRLRPMQLTDPPLLVSLPFLLTSALSLR